MFQKEHNMPKQLKSHPQKKTQPTQQKKKPKNYDEDYGDELEEDDDFGEDIEEDTN
jgi:hypothetical protein